MDASNKLSSLSITLGLDLLFVINNGSGLLGGAFVVLSLKLGDKFIELLLKFSLGSTVLTAGGNDVG